ncbi:MAG: hypothetical protein HXX18_12060 [Bacteroidetes bacterium]|nr:hypothetical protein [Bacteroidota bacterium]
MATENKWVRQPQERKRDYFFNGKSYITTNLMNEIPVDEIMWIISDLKVFIQQEQGIDYLVIYIRSDGRKIFCIDQLSKSMMESGDYTKEQIKEYNYWTMLFAEEY